jgi:hypothetical protein
MDSAWHQTIHRIGWSFWGLFAVTIHLWATLIAGRVPGSGGGMLSTALLPVISWFRLALTLPDEFSLMRNAFATSLIAWMGCGILLIAVRRLHPPLQRSERRG